LAKFLSSLDSQYEVLFGGIDSSNENIGRLLNNFNAEENKTGIFD